MGKSRDDNIKYFQSYRLTCTNRDFGPAFNWGGVFIAKTGSLSCHRVWGKYLKHRFCHSVGKPEAGENPCSLEWLLFTEELLPHATWRDAYGSRSKPLHLRLSQDTPACCSTFPFASLETYRSYAGGCWQESVQDKAKCLHYLKKENKFHVLKIMSLGHSQTHQKTKIFKQAHRGYQGIGGNVFGLFFFFHVNLTIWSSSKIWTVALIPTDLLTPRSRSLFKERERSLTQYNAAWSNTPFHAGTWVVRRDSVLRAYWKSTPWRWVCLY